MANDDGGSDQLSKKENDPNTTSPLYIHPLEYLKKMKVKDALTDKKYID